MVSAAVLGAKKWTFCGMGGGGGRLGMVLLLYPKFHALLLLQLSYEAVPFPEWLHNSCTVMYSLSTTTHIHEYSLCSYVYVCVLTGAVLCCLPFQVSS